MTLSILARDSRAGAFGGAAATGNLAVGGWVLRATADAGAVATQGTSVSSIWGDEAIVRLRDRQAPSSIVEDLTDGDPGREHRQLAVLGPEGAGAAWTGTENRDAKGQLIGEGYVITGNWLASTEVLAAMEQAFTATAADPQVAFADRLLSALAAGITAGGDARGTFSAALLVVSPAAPPLDLRVDYDSMPLDTLRALYQRATTPPYTEWIGRVPTLEDPTRC